MERQRAVVYPREFRDGELRHRKRKRNTKVTAWFDLPPLSPSNQDIRQSHEVDAFRLPKPSYLTPLASQPPSIGIQPPILGYKRDIASKEKQGAKRLFTVKLEKIESKAGLRKQLWEDLERYGLWQIPLPKFSSVKSYPEEWKDESVEQAVDAIWNQWSEHRPEAFSPATETVAIQNQYEQNQVKDEQVLEDGFEDFIQDESIDEADTVFMTSVKPESKPLPDPDSGSYKAVTETPEVQNDAGEETTLEIYSDGSPRVEVPDNSTDTLSLTPAPRPEYRLPGMQRRERLRELHQFVETQLQKRLYRHWDNIEISLSGSGDLTAAQVVKFLTHSDVQLKSTDAARVKEILEKHVDSTAEKEPSDMEGSHRVARRKKTVTYEDFKQLFHPRDVKQAALWRRQFDREKARAKQEKEIYQRELAALEAKVQKRLAIASKKLIDLVSAFKLVKREIPWKSSYERQEWRKRLMQMIFTKPVRRGESSEQKAENVASNDSNSVVPIRQSVRVIYSALLQKFSRNGHFEDLDLPIVIWMFHDLAAERMQSAVRTYWEKLKTESWPERQMFLQFRRKKTVFLAWKHFTKHADLLRRYVLRKFVAWAYVTRVTARHNKFFQTAFWPLYVWKRYLQRTIIARGKSAFLCEVLASYIQLRNFRAWKGRFRRNKCQKRQIVRVRKKKERTVIRLCWTDWANRTRSNRWVRQLWTTNGHFLQQFHKLRTVRLTWFLLRYNAILKKDARARQYLIVPEFRATASTQKESGSAASASSRRLSFFGSDRRVSNSQQQDNGIALRRIMETPLADKIKNRSQEYALCLQLYLNFREKDRRQQAENTVVFQRIGRAFLTKLRSEREAGKRKRFALVLGEYRILHERFRTWFFFALYKPAHDSSTALVNEVKSSDSKMEQRQKKAELHWKKDRKWRLHALKTAPLLSLQLKKEIQQVEANDIRWMTLVVNREQALIEKEEAEAADFQAGQYATLRVKAQLLKRSQTLLQMRSFRLHDALDVGFTNLRVLQYAHRLRTSFRGLRTFVMSKRVQKRGNRCKLRNWIRICHRFAFWYANAHRFYIRKLQYTCFQRLLLRVLWKFAHETVGLSEYLKRRQVLVSKYEKYLEAQGVFDEKSAAHQLVETKHSCANSLRGVFLRWVQQTQLSQATNKLVAANRRKLRVAYLRRIFMALHSKVRTYYFALERRQRQPYIVRQCDADMDAIRCKVLQTHAHGRVTALTNQLRGKRWSLERSAVGISTLRKQYVKRQIAAGRQSECERRRLLQSILDE